MTSVSTLSISDLRMAFDTATGPMHVLQGVSLDVRPGEIVGLVGESGSGKSTIAFACLGHLSANARVLAGDIQFQRESILAMSEARLTTIRGKRIAMVYQDPNTSLNPTLTIGRQVTEVLRRHLGLGSKDAVDRALGLLASVNLGDARGAMDKYPHQFSGGEKQRILIAMAFACRPELLVLDEPTTALDPTTAAGILDLIRNLQKETEVAAIYITHDLSTVAEISQRLNVIYAGKIVESGPTREVLDHPGHPYTRMLLASIPTAITRENDVRLAFFGGRAPDMYDPPRGCVFQERCPFVTEDCRTSELALRGAPHAVACGLYPAIATEPLPRSDAPTAQVESGIGAEDLFSVDDLEVRYRAVGSFFSNGARGPRTVRAVRGVSLRLGRGETLALVGESGSGKSSLARALVGLEAASGRIVLDEMTFELPVRLRASYRRRVQIIFQNPDQSLNPRQTVATIVARPLVVDGVQRAQRSMRVAELLQQVRLPPEYAQKYPHQLSGGERQRVAIARAFATTPDIVICDEITSALDVSVQASIVNLLADLQAAYGTSYLFISHDLNLVRRIADRVAVMYLGQIAETGATEQLFYPPYHPYTEALLGAVPGIAGSRSAPKIRLQGVPPSPANVPPGCPFASRCPRKLGPICDEASPPLLSLAEGHWLTCHIPPDVLRAPPPAMGDQSQAPNIVVPRGPQA